MSESYRHPGRIASAVDRSSCVSQCRSVRRARCSRVQQPHLLDSERLPTLESHARDGAVLERANHLWDAQIQPPTKTKIIAAAGTLIFCRRRCCSRQHKAKVNTHKLPRNISLFACASAAVWIVSGCQLHFPRRRTTPHEARSSVSISRPGRMLRRNSASGAGVYGPLATRCKCA
jgi:hypothetical protein